MWAVIIQIMKKDIILIAAISCDLKTEEADALYVARLHINRRRRLNHHSEIVLFTQHCVSSDENDPR